MEQLPTVKNESLPSSSAMDITEHIYNLIPTCGTIEATAIQKEILYAPVKEDDVEVRPDGLVYLPWMNYVERLKGAFGLSWAIVPQSPPMINNNQILWGFYLVIQGKLAGFAVGEQVYNQNNAKMTYGDALEGAKSNALMRLCKGIGISLELWKPSFVQTWKKKYAEEYETTDKYGKKVMRWRKKGSTEVVQPEEEVVPEDPKPAPKPEDASLVFETYMKHMAEIDNIVHLRNYWKKHFDGMKTLGTPMFMELEAMKNKLKAQFEEKEEE
jgi:hypothetical protein